MTTLFYIEPELVIALNKRVIFVNPNDLQMFKEIELPADLTKCGLKIVNNDVSKGGDDNTADAEQQKKIAAAQQPQEIPTIQHVAYSPSRLLLAITTAGQKAVLLYQCRPEHAKLISVRPLARASSALVFGADSESLLVTDKTGDCYQYNCVHLDEPPTLLFGHLSIVYDILWTEDRKYIITCDRDDKVRITNYPATHDIHGYCLGHKEFVSGMSLLQDDVILTISGDRTMRIWTFLNGEQCTQLELPAPGIRLVVRKTAENKFQAAVLLHQPNECVALYAIEKDSKDVWRIVELNVLSFPSMIVGNLCYAEERLYVAGNVYEHFTLKVVNNTPAPPENWIEMVEEQFKDDQWKLDDISMWFKKRYDNVSDYLERKKRRIEEKQK